MREQELVNLAGKDLYSALPPLQVSAVERSPVELMQDLQAKVSQTCCLLVASGSRLGCMGRGGQRSGAGVAVASSAAQASLYWCLVCLGDHDMVVQ